MKQLSLLVVILLIAGCGYTTGYVPPKTSSVSGKVLYSNGSPVPSGRVIFVPKEGNQAEGVAEIEGGSFKLTTYSKGDGAAPGAYSVYIEPKTYKGGSAKAVHGIPKKYTSKDTTTLSAVVKEGDNVFTFKLN